MIAISRVKSAAAEFIKVLRYGKNDVVTANQTGPAGIDSKPVPGRVAVYAQSTTKNESVILGYINDSSETNPGEIRIFGTDDSGVEVFYLHIKNNGTAEFNGSADNLVRFAPLNTNFAGLVDDINAETLKIFNFINALAPGGYPRLPIVRDVSGAKIDEIKTSGNI